MIIFVNDLFEMYKISHTLSMHIMYKLVLYSDIPCTITFKICKDIAKIVIDSYKLVFH